MSEETKAEVRTEWIWQHISPWPDSDDPTMMTTWRMRVPGGWIVRSCCWDALEADRDPHYALAMVFVPDPTR